MKTKRIITSIMSIALCASLMTGATYALFTDESKSSIAITSGTVSVDASIKNMVAYSPKFIYENGMVADADNGAVGNTFANGGTVGLADDGATVEFSAMTPGDKVTFDVVIANTSTIDVRYRVAAACETENELSKALVVDFGENAGEAKWTTNWMTLAQGTTEAVVPCSVELPIGLDSSNFEGLDCSLVFTVTALQGNTVENPTSSQTLKQSIETAVSEAIAAGETEAVVDLTENYDGSDWTTYNPQSMGKVDALTINGNGYSILGLAQPLFGNCSGKTTVINDLTIKNANIVYNQGNLGVSAFACYMDTSGTVTITDSKLINSTVKVTENENFKVGGFVGYSSSSWENAVTITNCQVSGCTIESRSSTGGFMGHVNYNTKVENCTITDTSVYCAESTDWRSGLVCGTYNGGTSSIVNLTENGNRIVQENSSNGDTIDFTDARRYYYGRVAGPVAQMVEGQNSINFVVA